LETKGVADALRVTAVVGDTFDDTVRVCVVAGDSVESPEAETSTVGPAEGDASFVAEDDRETPGLGLTVAVGEFCILAEAVPQAVALGDIVATLADAQAVAEGFEGDVLDVPDTEGDAD
jgi:hypothetical protein